MQEYKNIQKIIEGLWEYPLYQELLTKKIDTSLYTSLKSKIPDDYLLIEEVFPKDEIKDIWENFKPYLQEHHIFPCMGTLGEGVICIGYDEKKYGKIFYYDFDFGCFLLNECLDDFIKTLINKSAFK